MARRYVNPNAVRNAAPPNHEPRRGGHTHRHAHPGGTDGVDWTLDSDGCHEHPHFHGTGQDDLTPSNSHAHQHEESYFQTAPVTGPPGARYGRGLSAAATEHHYGSGHVDVHYNNASGATPSHRFIFGPEAPGDTAAARLNGFPWARSLSAFLAAIGDKDDQSGARGVIRQVMEESRPRAAAGLSERIPSEGGYLVPEVLARKIESYMTGAVIVPRSQQIPMTSLRQPVPVLDAPNQSSGVLGGMTFSMVAESANIPATVPEFGVLALEARKFAAYLTTVPNELCDDSPVFSEIFLPQLVGRGLAWQEDYLAVNGNGIAEPQGLLSAPAALFQVRATSDDVTVPDVVGMLKQLHPASKRSESTCWLLGDDVFGVLLELATITGTTPTSAASGPTLWLEYDAGAGFWRLLGYPAFPTDWQPALGSTGDCILVDLDQYLWGTRGEMTIERSMKGSGFINDTSNFRFRHRIDGRLWPQQSYTLSNSQVVSPLVILEVAA